MIIPSQCNPHAPSGNWTINDAWDAEIKAVQDTPSKQAHKC